MWKCMTVLTSMWDMYMPLSGDESVDTWRRCFLWSRCSLRDVSSESFTCLSNRRHHPHRRQQPGSLIGFVNYHCVLHSKIHFICHHVRQKIASSSHLFYGSYWHIGWTLIGRVLGNCLYQIRNHLLTILRSYMLQLERITPDGIEKLADGRWR